MSLPVSLKLFVLSNRDEPDGLSSPTNHDLDSLVPIVPDGASLQPNHQYAVDLGNDGLVASTANALSLNLKKQH